MSPGLLSQQIRKCYYKTLGTSLMNSPMSSTSLFLFDSKKAGVELAKKYFVSTFDVFLRLDIKSMDL